MTRRGAYITGEGVSIPRESASMSRGGAAISMRAPTLFREGVSISGEVAPPWFLREPRRSFR